MKRLPPLPKVETETQKRDFDKWFVPEGDPDFNEYRNKEVIERTIAKYESQLANRKRQIENAIGERVQAVVSWLFSVKSTHTPIEKYLGKRLYAQMRGEQILKTIKRNQLGEIVVKLDSKD